MFKRLFWMLVGATLGAGGSFWLARAVRQTIQRYAPARLSNQLRGSVRSLGEEVRLALEEGRQAMQERERVLRAQLEARGSPR